MNSGAQHFVILVRHASRERRWHRPESTHWMKDWNKGSKISSPEESDSDAKGGAEGLGRTYALAGRLCDELKILAGEQREKIIIKGIGHSIGTL
jgi:hypothetical protein